MTVAQGGIVGIFKGMIEGVEIRSSFKSSFFLMPAAQHAFALCKPF
jgi:hypothetical protein